MSNQLRTDVENWADQKLDQWARDVCVRCEIADIDPGPIITALTTAMTALLIARQSSMPPERAGLMLAEAVARFRAKNEAQGK
jgi:hypothetical protein